MKLKRFVAIVISLAMVLSIVPAFSLTASAADMSDAALLDYAKTTSPLFDAMNPAPTAAADTAIATAWPNSGWSGGNGNSPDANGGYLNVAGGTATPRIQAYVGSETNGSSNISTITLPGYGAGNDWVLLSFTAEHTAAWGDVALYDIDGAIITGFRTGTGGINAVWGHTGWGNPYNFSSRTYSHLNAEGTATAAASGSAKVDVLMRNYADYYTASVYVNGTLANTTTYTGATFNGLGSIAMNRGSGKSWERISLQQPLVYAGDIPATNVEVVATYKAGDITAKTESKSYDTTTDTGVSFNAYTYAPNGGNAIYTAEAVTLSESATIEMTKLTNNGTYAVGDTIDYNSKQYNVVGENLIPNGDFSQGTLGWYAGNGAAANFFTSNGDGTMTTTVGNTGQGGENSLYRAWKVTPGKTYAFTYYSSGGGEWHKTSVRDDVPTAATENNGTIVMEGTAGSDNLYVFTAANNYIQVSFRWLATNGGEVFGNFGLYEVEENTSAYQKVTVNYDYNGTTLATEVLEGTAGATVTAPAKSIAVENGIVVFNAKDYTVGTTATTETLTYTKFVSLAGGLVANYNFADGDATDSVNGFDGSVIGSKGVTFNENGYVTMPGGVAQGALEIPAEVATYLTGDFTVSMWVKQDTSYASDSKSVAFWDIAVDSDNYDRLFYQQAGTGVTVQHRGTNPSRVYTTYTNNATKGKWALVTASFDLDANTLTTYINGVALTDGATTDTWGTGHAPANIYNRANGGISFYLGHNQWNNADNPELMGDMADVRIYNKALTSDEVAALMDAYKTVTVKYMADGAEVTDNTVVEYFTTEATLNIPTAVTSSTGAVYELTSLEYAEDAATVTVKTSDAEYVAEYTSVEAIPTGIKEVAAVTVIEGNEPILPSTVTVVTNKAGIEYEANVTWNTANITVGTNTVTGTVEGYDVEAEVSVTVLEETFNMNDVEAHAGQSTEAIHYFPVAATGEVVVEFDVVFHQLVNGTITIGDAESNGGNNPVFGGTGDAISIQTNSGGVNIRSWGTTGGAGSADRNVTTPVVTGDTYRFLITTNTDNDTWNAVMTDKNGVQTVVADGHGYRKVVDKLDSITVLDNNGVADTISVSNIKIYAPAQASALTEYTIVVTGSVTDSYTEKAKSVDALEIPYYAGNIFKSRSVSGTTVTYTYEASVDTLGTWAIRNNVMSNTWISEMKYLGTHNSFADNDSPVVNEGGALAGVTGASTTGSLATSMSQTQTADALEQLNMGVRYFDIRLTRQEDGTFWSFHGPAFSNFNLYAHTIGQWAKEHPGEVIILDFHEAWDALYGGDADGSYAIVTGNTTYYGEEAGDDNQYFYDALEQLLTEAGIMELVPTNFDQRYGAMTAEGTKTAILTVSKGRGANCIGKFQSRDTWTSGDTTYVESGSVSTVANTIESAITAGTFGSGPKFGTIHAYVTPTTGLISAANTANTQWTAYDLDKWMTSGYGDIFMINNVTQEVADTYLAILSEYNRDYLDDQLGSEFHGETALSAGGLTMTGATGSVPFSTEFTVSSEAATGTYTIDGKTYTAITTYDIDLLQFDTDPVALTGEVTVTFPKVSADDTTVDALLSSDGTQVYWTAEVGEAVAIPTSALADVILATTSAPSVEFTVVYKIDGETVYTDGPRQFLLNHEAYNYPVSTGAYVKLGDKAYIVSSTEAQSKTITTADAGLSSEVNFTLVHDNAVIADAFHNSSDYKPWNNTEDKLFIGSAGASNAADTDADNAATFNGGGNVGSARVPLLTFNVPEVADGQAVKLNLYVAEINGNLGIGKTMKLAANVSGTEANETTNALVAADIANLEGIVWSDTMATQGQTETRTGVYNCDQWISIDVTDFVKAAEGSTITFTLYAPTAGAYIADREKAVAGGAYEGMAAYLDVVDAYTVKVGGASQITKNGNAVTSTTEVVAYEGAQIKLYETSDTTPAFTNGTKVYATDNTTGATPYITVTGATTYYAATVGIAPVAGAQVRIGDGVNSEGKIDGTNSGLRFITTVNMNETLAGVEGATFGVEITAEGSTAAAVKIPTTEWQKDGEVFTSALTNLAVGNFNRKFKATPYVIADDQTFYGSSVERSVYQVAAGLLLKGYDLEGDENGVQDDKTGTDYTEMSDKLIKVLNAYVNQTGIRLTLTDNALTARTTGNGAYSGEAFFEVGTTTVDGTKYTVTLTPIGEAEINTELFAEYVRINNNNSTVTLNTTIEEKDGSYVITFDSSVPNKPVTE